MTARLKPTPEDRNRRVGKPCPNGCGETVLQLLTDALQRLPVGPCATCRRRAARKVPAPAPGQKRTYKCRRCGGEGHGRPTCKKPLGDGLGFAY